MSFLPIDMMIIIIDFYERNTWYCNIVMRTTYEFMFLGAVCMYIVCGCVIVKWACPHIRYQSDSCWHHPPIHQIVIMRASLIIVQLYQQRLVLYLDPIPNTYTLCCNCKRDRKGRERRERGEKEGEREWGRERREREWGRERGEREGEREKGGRERGGERGGKREKRGGGERGGGRERGG